MKNIFLASLFITMLLLIFLLIGGQNKGHTTQMAIIPKMENQEKSRAATEDQEPESLPVQNLQQEEIVQETDLITEPVSENIATVENNPEIKSTIQKVLRKQPPQRYVRPKFQDILRETYYKENVILVQQIQENYDRILNRK